MKLPILLSAIVEVLRSADATEEIIAAAINAGGEAMAPQGAKWTARKHRQIGRGCPPGRHQSCPPGQAA
jgi:hypothetical protein